MSMKLDESRVPLLLKGFSINNPSPKYAPDQAITGERPRYPAMVVPKTSGSPVMILRV
jgi:hypothetical protein